MAPELLISGLIILFSHFVGAITAYGSTLLALPMLVWVVNDLPTCVQIILLVGIVQSYQIMLYTYRQVDWGQLRRMLTWAVIGLPLGYMSMRYLPKTPLLMGLGVIASAAGIYRLVDGTPNGSRVPPGWALNLLLFAGGVIHGAFMAGGATVVIYSQYMLPKKENFRATMCMFWVVLNTLLMSGHIAQKSITWHAGKFALVGLPFLLVGSWLGELAARRIPQKRFTQLVSAMLVVAGISVIVKCLNT